MERNHTTRKTVYHDINLTTCLRCASSYMIFNNMLLIFVVETNFSQHESWACCRSSFSQDTLHVVEIFKTTTYSGTLLNSFHLKRNKKDRSHGTHRGTCWVKNLHKTIKGEANKKHPSFPSQNISTLLPSLSHSSVSLSRMPSRLRPQKQPKNLKHAKSMGSDLFSFKSWSSLGLHCFFFTFVVPNLRDLLSVLLSKPPKLKLTFLLTHFLP